MRLTNFRRVLPLLFALVLGLTQSLSLLHAHEGDLNAQPDCEVCLKLGTFDDLLPGEEPRAEFLSGASLRPVPLVDAFHAALPARKSRAPPATS